MKKTIVLVVLTMGLWTALVGWIYAQRPSIAVPHISELIPLPSQETINALQGDRLSQLTVTVNKHSDQLVELEADRNWLMGGLGTVGGIFIIVQIMQIVTIRKKDS